MPSKRGKRKSHKQKEPGLVDIATGKACAVPVSANEDQLDTGYEAEEEEQEEGSETNFQVQEYEIDPEEEEEAEVENVNREWVEDLEDDEEENEEEQESECDCDPDNIERPKCPFEEADTVCFFRDLPNLELPQYLQCQNCGKRFEPEDFEPHCLLCWKIPVDAPMPRVIPKEERTPKYGPPFLLKKIVPKDSCPPSPCCYKICKEEDLCGF